MKFLIISIALALVPSVQAASQVIYKCGNTFSDIKCSSDATVAFKSAEEKQREIDEKRRQESAAALKASIADMERRKRKLAPRTWGAESMERVQELCKIHVLSSLKDPNSANFSNFALTHEPVAYISNETEKYQFASEVLFFVNAKNGFGGYTGDKLWKCLIDWDTGRKVVSVQSLDAK